MLERSFGLSNVVFTRNDACFELLIPLCGVYSDDKQSIVEFVRHFDVDDDSPRARAGNKLRDHHTRL